jgi:membrane-associated protease RseP (regulator of RpoE activity)
VTVAPHKPYEQATLQLLEHELALSSQLARADSLRAQLSAARKTLSTLNIDEVRIDRLQREKEIAEAKYRKYSAVLEEARIDNALDAHCMSNISIVQAASFDPQPVQPRWPVILAGGLAAALLGAIALAVIAEYLSVPSLVPVAPPALENQSHSTPAASSNGNGNGAGNENGAALVGSTGKLRSTSAA